LTKYQINPKAVEDEMEVEGGAEAEGLLVAPKQTQIPSSGRRTIYHYNIGRGL
jgi:hypothetical protein